MASICFKNLNRSKRCINCWINLKRIDPIKKKEGDLFRSRCYTLLKRCLKRVGKEKKVRSTNLLGYSSQQLKERIESHPNWKSVKDGNWHIDHIFPINAFVNHGIKDIQLINHLDNLQPLGEIENVAKGDKYDEQDFLKWLSEH